jgi:hypothetical protein
VWADESDSYTKILGESEKVSVSSKKKPGVVRVFVESGCSQGGPKQSAARGSNKKKPLISIVLGLGRGTQSVPEFQELGNVDADDSFSLGSQPHCQSCLVCLMRVQGYPLLAKLRVRPE